MLMFEMAYKEEIQSVLIRIVRGGGAERLVELEDGLKFNSEMEAELR